TLFHAFTAYTPSSLFLMLPRPPRSPLFPYTTLFRSPTFRRYMPEHFYTRAYGVRSMLDAGLTVALSTDAPVVADANPLLGLKSAIDRRDHAGVPLGPNQAITAAEALYAYTQAGARLSGDEHNRGSISRGKWADLVVLSGDPLTTPPDELLGLVVEQTYVAGELAYERA